MKLAHIAAVAALSVGALVSTASSASAAIVCNANNVCWHTQARYNYRPAYGVVVHENGWRWGDNERYQWREHRGRGYWDHDHWRRF